MMRIGSWIGTLGMTALACTACDGRPEREARAGALEDSAERMTAVVDSVLPMAVMLERFRAGLERPERVTSGATNRDELVERIVGALERSDTMALEPLALGIEEFAWLYYPVTAIAQVPYEVPPGVAWLQMQQRNRDGVLRAMREYGGIDLDFRSYRCDPEPSIEGDNRMWRNCIVTIARPGESARDVRLFGTIIERDGRFAIVSYTNDF